jgi:hypothetical protein
MTEFRHPELETQAFSMRFEVRGKFFSVVPGALGDDN